MSGAYRTTRILHQLAKHPAGLTHTQAHALAFATDPASLTTSTNVMLHHLVRTGQATTTGKYSTRLFFPLSPAPEPVGGKGAAPPTPRAKARKAKALAPALAAKTATRTATPVGSTAAKVMDSARIARDIAAFKRTGGCIEKLPIGASAQPLDHDHPHASPSAGYSARALIRAQRDQL